MDVEGRPRNSCMAVEGSNVCFNFGNRTILYKLNISVERGAIYGLLGPSGCGKTTLLRCIVGRHRPTSGTIKIFGKRPGKSGFNIPGPGVGFMPQELALYPEITTEETLMYFGRLYQMTEKAIKERISFLADFLDIPDKKKMIKNLSGGQQRRVSFAAALIHKPPLVILDEPTVGVDPLLRKSIWNYLQKLASVDFLTIIITTHYVDEARKAHVVGLMRDGRLLAEANPDYLMKLHKAETLEDVFLKLCMKEMGAGGAQEDANCFEKLESNHESQDDVWVPRKIQQKHNYLAITADDGSEYKSSLLKNPADPETILNPERNCGSGIKESAVRIKAVVTKNVVRLKRNLPLVGFQVFIPAIQVIIFCLCVGGEPFDLPLGIVNLETDPSGKSTHLLEQLNGTGTIIQIPFSNLTPALESAQRGEIWGVLYIKPTFTDSLINRLLEGTDADNQTIDDGTTLLYLDMTNQQIALTLYLKIMETFQDFAVKMLKSFYKNPLLVRPPVILGEPVYGHERPNYTEFMLPGMIIGITYIMAVALSTLSIILEKKEGLLDRSWIAGVRSWEVMFSILFVLFVVMLFQVALVLLLTFFAFKMTVLGNLVWVIITVLLGGLEGMAFGLFISSIASNENTAVMITMGSFFPSLILGGLIWPIEAMPYYLKQFSYGLPLTLLVHTLRCILSKGWSVTENGIWNGYIVAFAWIVPVIIISSLFFKYKK